MKRNKELPTIGSREKGEHDGLGVLEKLFCVRSETELAARRGDTRVYSVWYPWQTPKVVTAVLC